MKLQNFRRLDPLQQGKGLSAGGKGEEEVWATFSHDPARLRATAEAISAALMALETEPALDDQGEDGAEAEEGSGLTRLHRVRERDRAIVERRKAAALRQHGRLFCDACGFDFVERYGERGRGFIECHHTKPVSSLLPGERTRLAILSYKSRLAQNETLQRSN